MALSKKAQTSLDGMIEKFQSGDLSALVQLATIQWPEDAPGRAWTAANQTIAFAQSGHIDNRGYRQWQDAGRQVQKGKAAAFIIRPRTAQKEDKETGEKRPIVIGWGSIPVHPYTNTEPIDDAEALVYEPADPPPLADVAAAWGIPLNYGPSPDNGTRGSFTYNAITGQPHEISLHTDDIKVFFHELSHAADTKLGNIKECAGQDPEREATADLAACVLCDLYGIDRTGNTWQYIASYHKDPLAAISRAINNVAAVVELILDTAETKGEETA